MASMLASLDLGCSLGILVSGTRRDSRARGWVDTNASSPIIALHRGMCLPSLRLTRISLAGAVPQTLRGMPASFGGQQPPQQPGRSVSSRLPNGKLGKCSSGLRGPAAGRHISGAKRREVDAVCSASSDDQRVRLAVWRRRTHQRRRPAEPPCPARGKRELCAEP